LKQTSNERARIVGLFRAVEDTFQNNVEPAFTFTTTHASNFADQLSIIQRVFVSQNLLEENEYHEVIKCNAIQEEDRKLLFTKILSRIAM
jgi:hypothetical protein